MVLVEGLGDEVTLVLGSFLIIVILLLAWLSTHTNDIQLIREVGVIVVELRQRHRNRQVRTEQPPEVEISQSSRDGIPSPISEQESGSDGLQAEENNFSEESQERTEGQRVDVSHGQRLGSDLSPSLSELEDPAASQIKSSKVSSEEINSSPSDTAVPFFKENEPGNEQSHTNSEDEVEEDLTASMISGLSPSIPSETEEQTLRKRRVQYFESGQSGAATNKLELSCETPEGLMNISDDDNTKQSVTVSNLHDCDIRDRHLPSSPAEGVKQCDINSARLDTHRVSNDSSSSNQRSEQRHQESQLNFEEQEEGSGGDFIGSRIRVKLKYMNETQRFVYASPEDTIGDFRRAHFQPELADNKWVRFIFNGQDLRDDSRTLQACNIENNCTMHCLVTTRQRPGERQEVPLEDEDESMLGALMYPLFTLLLLVVWYFRIFYRQYFSAMSTVCLIGISFLLALSYVSSIRPSDAATGPQQPTEQRSAGGRTDGRQNHPHSD